MHTCCTRTIKGVLRWYSWHFDIKSPQRFGLVTTPAVDSSIISVAKRHWISSWARSLFSFHWLCLPCLIFITWGRRPAGKMRNDMTYRTLDTHATWMSWVHYRRLPTDDGRSITRRHLTLTDELSPQRIIPHRNNSWRSIGARVEKIGMYSSQVMGWWYYRYCNGHGHHLRSCVDHDLFPIFSHTSSRHL